MKFLLALPLILISTVALADGPVGYDYGTKDFGARYQQASYTSARELREYRAWKAAQRRAEQRRYERLEALEARERRNSRAARLRRLEARYAAEEARERRVVRRRADTRAARALERERALYAAQRKRYYSGRDVVVEEEERRTSMASMCKPALTAYGPPKTSQLRARRAARLNWVAQVVARHTADYANPERAANARYLCDPVPTTSWPIYACKFRAAPCRGEF